MRTHITIFCLVVLSILLWAQAVKAQDSVFFQIELKYQNTPYAESEDTFWEIFYEIGEESSLVYFVADEKTRNYLVEKIEVRSRDPILYQEVFSFTPVNPSHYIELILNETDTGVKGKAKITSYATTFVSYIDFTINEPFNQASNNNLNKPILEFFSKIDSTLHGHGMLDQAFPINSDALEVLVLPFKEFGGNESNASFVITQGLADLNHKNNLNLSLAYYEDYRLPIDRYKDESFIRSLLEYHNADMLIYGEHYDGVKMVFYYYAKEHPNIEKNQNIKNPTHIDASVKDLYTIRAGKLQGDVNFIIHWLAALSASKQSDYKKAHQLYEYINNSLDAEIPIESKKSVFKETIATCIQVGTYELAFDYIDAALVFYEKVGCTTAERIDILRLKAYNYVTAGNHFMGLKTGCECLKTLPENNIVNGNTLAEVLLSIQLSYGYLGKSEKAIEVGNQILGLKIDTVSAPNIIPLTHLNIGAEYNNFFDTTLIRPALNHFNWVLDYTKKRPPVDKGLVAGALRGIGTTHWINGDYDQAKHYFLRTLQIEDETLSPFHPVRSYTYFNLAVVYQKLAILSYNPLELDQVMLDSVLFYHTKGYEVNKATPPTTLAQIHAMEGLSVIHALKGNLAEALTISTDAYNLLNIIEKHELGLLEEIQASMSSPTTMERQIRDDNLASSLAHELGCNDLEPITRELAEFIFLDKRITLSLNIAEIARRNMEIELDIIRQEEYRLQGLEFLEVAQELFQSYPNDHHMYPSIKQAIDRSTSQLDKKKSTTPSTNQPNRY